MTEVERFNDSTGAWEPIDYGSFNIEFGVSDILIAPQATVTAARTSPVSAGERIRVRENTTTTFEGRVQRTKPRTKGPMRIEAEHDAHALFDDTVTLNVTGTDEDVLNAALSDAGDGSWTLNYVGTATTLGDDYEVDGRTVKRVFRDMVDRTGRIWWVGVDHTITVAAYGAGGQLAAVDTATDDVVVDEYTPADLETVLNDVTVVGTGGQSVTGTASDSTSISDYGRQPERLNVSYIRSAGEADAYASAVLNPEPDAAASVRVGASVGPVASPVVNQTLDVTDTQGTGMNESLVIEKQTVQQGVADLDLGEGAGTNVEKFNRREKSKGDVTEPGSVYDSDRIADGAVTEFELDDNSVTTAKVENSAIIADKLDDSAVTTRAIAQAAINGDKIQTGAIGATKLFVADWIPIGLQFTDDDPNAGDVSWNSHELVYNGTTYSISSGSTSDEYIYWLEGDSSYTTADFKPFTTQPEGDTLVCINDNGSANRLLNATSIHGGSIVTNSIRAAEIRTGTLTADEIDTLALDTNQLTIGADIDGGWEFGVTGSGVGTMEPTGTGGQIGIDAARVGAYLGAVRIDQNVLFDGFNPLVRPETDNDGELGTSNNAWSGVYAYNYIDAGTGTAINDGGDPMAGVAEGHGPPDTCAVHDDGDVKGYSINQMTREAWDVIREQARRIEDLEARLEDLEDGANA